MKKTCERCANCYKEYMLGGYPTPVCKIYGYLEEIDNPHHDLDGEKCSDYTYPMVKISFDTAKSPLQRLYNTEKTLFPDTKINIDDFEKILAEIYSERNKRTFLSSIRKEKTNVQNT